MHLTLLNNTALTTVRVRIERSCRSVGHFRFTTLRERILVYYSIISNSANVSPVKRFVTTFFPIRPPLSFYNVYCCVA